MTCGNCDRNAICPLAYTYLLDKKGPQFARLHKRGDPETCPKEDQKQGMKIIELVKFLIEKAKENPDTICFVEGYEGGFKYLNTAEYMMVYDTGNPDPHFGNFEEVDRCAIEYPELYPDKTKNMIAGILFHGNGTKFLPIGDRKIDHKLGIRPDSFPHKLSQEESVILINDSNSEAIIVKIENKDYAQPLHFRLSYSNNIPYLLLPQIAAYIRVNPLEALFGYCSFGEVICDIELIRTLN